MKNILIALSDRDLLRSYGELLKTDGWNVTEAFDGLQAMKALADGETKVALIDQSLPRAGLKELLSEAEERHTPVVLALSDRWAYETSVKEAGKESGAVAGKVTYPFPPDELLSILQTIYCAEDEEGS
ncbi:MAG: hypothetical protein IKS34_02205 [Clostridia bacterium]|nr:hypothetical protein [Clostridia bacterium]